MDVRKLLAPLAVVLLAMALYFFVTGNIALAAAMFAIAMSQLATFAALSAAAKKAAGAAQGQGGKS
jgi:hypothetical protein